MATLPRNFVNLTLLSSSPSRLAERMNSALTTADRILGQDKGTRGGGRTRQQREKREEKKRVQQLGTIDGALSVHEYSHSHRIQGTFSLR